MDTCEAVMTNTSKASPPLFDIIKTDEILVLLLKFTTLQQKCVLSVVCKRFKRILDSSFFWKKVDLTGHCFTFDFNIEKLLQILEPRKQFVEELILDSWSNVKIEKILETFPNLKLLDLTSCSLLPPTKQPIFSLPSIKSLRLETLILTNSTSDATYFPEILKLCPSIKRLSMANTLLTRFSLLTISQLLKSLEVLDLSYCPQAHALLRDFTCKDFPKLHTLFLSDDDNEHDNKLIAKNFPNTTIINVAYLHLIEQLKSKNDKNIAESLQKFNKLIYSGADKTVEINGMTPLHYLLHALQKGPQFVTVLKTMIALGDDGKPYWAVTKLLHHGKMSMSLFGQAVALCDHSLVAHFISLGGDPELPIQTPFIDRPLRFSRDDLNFSILEAEDLRPTFPLCIAIQKQDWNLAALLVQYISASVLHYQLYRCLEYVHFNSTAFSHLVEVVKDRNINWNNVAFEGKTLLCAAIMNGKLSIVQALLNELNVNPNCLSKWDDQQDTSVIATPLYFALRQMEKSTEGDEAEQILCLLLQKGANVHSVGVSQNTPLSFTSKNAMALQTETHILSTKPRKRIQRPTLSSIFYAPNTRALKLLLDYGAHVDALDDENYTLLWNSVKKKDQDFVQCLLKGGANADFVGKLNGNDINLFQVSSLSDCCHFSTKNQ
jgi:hypothetical protein